MERNFLLELSMLLRLHALPASVRGAVYYGITYGALAVYLPFLNVYLKTLGLSGWQIGLLSALLPLGSLLLAPVIAAFADRTHRRVSVLVAWTLALALTLLLFILPAGFWALLVVMALRAVFYSPMTPLADSMAVRMAERNGLNFGDMRLWGSITFALIAVGCGAIWQHWGYRPMFVAAAVLYVLVALVALSLEEGPAVERSRRSPLRAVGKDSFLILLMAATFLASAGTGMDMTFAGIYMVQLGGTGLMVGALFCIPALCEPPMMRYSGAIRGVLGGSGTLLVAYGLFVCAYLGYAAAAGPMMLLAFSALRGLAFGLYYVSTVRLINERTPPEWSATAQGIMAALAMGLAQLIAGPVSGRIFDARGPVAVYLTAAGCVGAAMLILVGAIIFRVSSAKPAASQVETVSAEGPAA